VGITACPALLKPLCQGNVASVCRLHFLLFPYEKISSEIYLMEVNQWVDQNKLFSRQHPELAFSPQFANE
jgi:hypothetical protein